MVKKCCKCNKVFYYKHYAISRRDNETKICSKCGEDEAMFDFLIHQKELDKVYSKEEVEKMKAKERSWLQE